VKKWRHGKQTRTASARSELCEVIDIVKWAGCFDTKEKAVQAIKRYKRKFPHYKYIEESVTKINGGYRAVLIID
jgi:hypothetical protein